MLAREAVRITYTTATTTFTASTTAHKDGNLNVDRIAATQVLGSDAATLTFTYTLGDDTEVVYGDVEAIQAQQRSHEGVLYYVATSATAPDAPATSGLSYNFATRTITGLPATVTQNPITLPEGTTTANPYRVRYTVTEAFCGATSQTFAFGTPEQITTFGTDIQSDNFVTGSAGWQLERATGDAELNNVEVRGTLLSSGYNGTLGGTEVIYTFPRTGEGIIYIPTIGTVVSGFTPNQDNSVIGDFGFKTEPSLNADNVFNEIKSSLTADELETLRGNWVVFSLGVTTFSIPTTDLDSLIWRVQNADGDVNILNLTFSEQKVLLDEDSRYFLAGRVFRFTIRAISRRRSN